MSAKQNSQDVRWARAVAQVGFVGTYLALITACSGSIAETDYDRTRAERASNSPAPTTPAPVAPAARPATTTPPATTPPVASVPPATTPPATTPPATTPPAATTPTSTASVSFEADIYPIFSAACAGCHGANGFSGVSVADPNVDAALENAIAEEASILERIENGTMPQGCVGGVGGSSPSCLSQDDFDKLEAWYEAGSPE